MSLAIDTVDGRDLNNVTCHYLHPNKINGNAVLAFHIIVQGVLAVVHY